MFHEVGVTLAFDAVAGEMTGQLLAGMPRGGRVTVYGGLSDEASVVNPSQLIFENKTVDGFWLSEWITKISIMKLMRIAFTLQKMVSTDLETAVQARVSLEDATTGLETYMEEMTKGKVLIVP